MEQKEQPLRDEHAALAIIRFAREHAGRRAAEGNAVNLVRFTVRDTGIGIAPEFQRVIFEEFAQVQSPLQKRLRGTGLGLSLAKKLAELLGAPRLIPIASAHIDGALYHGASDVAGEIDLIEHTEGLFPVGRSMFINENPAEARKSLLKNTFTPEDVRNPANLERLIDMVRRCHRDIPQFLRGPGAMPLDVALTEGLGRTQTRCNFPVGAQASFGVGQ